MTHVGLVAAVAYGGMVITPCTPAGAVTTAPVPQLAPPAASADEHQHDPVANGEAHPPKGSSHSQHAATTSLVAFCACGCDAPGAAESKTRMQSNALRGHAPSWLPPSGDATFPETPVLLLAEPLRTIDNVPVSLG